MTTLWLHVIAWNIVFFKIIYIVTRQCLTEQQLIIYVILLKIVLWVYLLYIILVLSFSFQKLLFLFLGWVFSYIGAYILLPGWNQPAFIIFSFKNMEKNHFRSGNTSIIQNISSSTSHKTKILFYIKSN